jgi:hypothetical protein
MNVSFASDEVKVGELTHVRLAIAPNGECRAFGQQNLGASFGAAPEYAE